MVTEEVIKIGRSDLIDDALKRYKNAVGVILPAGEGSSTYDYVAAYAAIQFLEQAFQSELPEGLRRVAELVIDDITGKDEEK